MLPLTVQNRRNYGVTRYNPNAHPLRNLLNSLSMPSMNTVRNIGSTIFRAGAKRPYSAAAGVGFLGTGLEMARRAFTKKRKGMAWAHRAGTTKKTKGKRPSRRLRRIKRGRARRYRSFKKKVISTMNPSCQYRLYSNPVTMTQDYNKKIMHSPFTYLSRTFLSTMAADYASKSGNAISTLTGKMHFYNARVNYTITNNSPTKTWLTLYWFRYKDNTSKTFADLIAQDVTKGYLASVISSAGATQPTTQVTLMTKLSDFKTLFQFCKLVGKESYNMDGGGVVSGSHRFRRAVHYVYNYNEDAASSANIRGVTEFCVLMGRSQLVANGDSATEPTAVVDNSLIFMESRFQAKQAGQLVRAWIPPSATISTRTLTGTPTAYVEDAKQDS